MIRSPSRASTTSATSPAGTQPSVPSTAGRGARVTGAPDASTSASTAAGRGRCPRAASKRVAATASASGTGASRGADQFAHQDGVEKEATGSADRLGQGHVDAPELAQASPELRREACLLAGPHHLGGALAVEQATVRALELLLLIREPEIEHRHPPIGSGQHS